MKKYLLLIAFAFSITNLFAQAANSSFIPGTDSDTFFHSVLIVLVCIIAFFLIVRAFWLWYWKIYEILGNQRQTNELLSAILKELRKNNPDKTETDKPELPIDKNEPGIRWR